MTKTIVQCPNAACGRVSGLAEDPLGRIFRCPRCLTKLPTAAASAADSGWTAVMESSRFGNGGRSLAKVVQSRRQTPLNPAVGGASNGRDRRATVFDAVETSLAFGAMPLGAASSPSDDDSSSELRLGPDDSGEVVIAPVSSRSRSGSTWESQSRSSATMTAAASGALASPSGSLPMGLGTVLGRFRILGFLGQGDHATVYRAYDPLLERDVALKVPRQGVLKTTKMLDRFLGEAKALARLRHPRIVPVYEAGCAGDRHYIAMALIEGRSLVEQLAERPIPVDRAAAIITDLAEALAYAHTQGVVHRDIKPANIRLDQHGAAHLMDFGIAYRPDSGETPLPPGMILGTPAYLAPEQAQGGQTHVLPASDQYSLGVVFYELLCGRPPFCGPPPFVLFHTIHHAPPSPRTVARHVPRALAAICLKALAKSPSRRYADCQHLADDLKRWLGGETPRAYRRGWSALGVKG